MWFQAFFVLREGYFDWERVKIIVQEERDHMFGISLGEWLEYTVRGTPSRRTLSEKLELPVGILRIGLAKWIPH